MSNHTDYTYETTDPVEPARYVERPAVAEHTVERSVVEQPRRFGAFVAGFLTATLAFVAGIMIFLAVSDSDDDGNIDLEVPAVDVNVGG